MSMFSKLRKLFGTVESAQGKAPSVGGRWRSLITPLGTVTPECPYCRHIFDKMPQRKRTCPSCGQTLFSRKRPYDGEKALLTVADANAVEAQQELLGFSVEHNLEDGRMDGLLSAVESRNPKALTAEDLVAEVLSALEKRHAGDWKWGLYRNDRFKVAESQARRGLTADALRTLLHVCFLDLNGPNNVSPNAGLPAFNPSHAMLAPGILKRAEKLASELQWGSSELQREFMGLPGVPDPRAILPVSRVDAWTKLAKEIG